MTEAKVIRTLEHLAAHLTDRIAAEERGQRLDHYSGELAALQIAISRLTAANTAGKDVGRRALPVVPSARASPLAPIAPTTLSTR
jgi:hypothetical protein